MTLEADGLWAGLRWLNDRVPYGFTAIFAFDGDTLRNICLPVRTSLRRARCVSSQIGFRDRLIGALGSALIFLVDPNAKVFSATAAFHCLTRKEKCSARCVTSIACTFG
jgi:hypothetical protein